MSDAQNLWAITCYFNPLGYQSRRKNYDIFRRSLSVPLVTVEWSQDGRFHLAPGDADIIVQVECADFLWQKERLLNIAMQSVPRDCGAVAWLDCDVVFERPDWPERTAELLREFQVVEPFSLTYEAGKDELPGPKRDKGYSMMHALDKGIVTLEILRGNMRVDARISSGLAWAARREVLDRHGLYDACVMGSGNRAIAAAALGRFGDAIHYLRMNPNWTTHYMQWAQPYFDTIQGSVGYLEGSLFHLWHGELENRRYAERHEFLGEHNFDPAKDIFIGDNGAWRWNGAKARMEEHVRGYFQSRREDG